jgi:hypothetical protein
MKDGNEEETSLTTNSLSHPGPSKQTTSPTFQHQNPSTSQDIPFTSFPKPNPVLRRKEKHHTGAYKLMKHVQEMNEPRKDNTPTLTLDNPIDCFLFGLSSTFKSLPPYLQHSAKAEVFSTLQKYEFQMLQNKIIDCSLRRGDQETPNGNPTSFQSSQPIRHTSATGSVREYWQNFNGQQN